MDEQMPEAVNDGSEQAEERLKRTDASETPLAEGDAEPDPQVTGPHTPHRAVDQPDDLGKETDGNVPVANLE